MNNLAMLVKLEPKDVETVCDGMEWLLKSLKNVNPTEVAAVLKSISIYKAFGKFYIPYKAGLAFQSVDELLAKEPALLSKMWSAFRACHVAERESRLPWQWSLRSCRKMPKAIFQKPLQHTSSL